MHAQNDLLPYCANQEERKEIIRLKESSEGPNRCFVDRMPENSGVE